MWKLGCAEQDGRVYSILSSGRWMWMTKGQFFPKVVANLLLGLGWWEYGRGMYFKAEFFFLFPGFSCSLIVEFFHLWGWWSLTLECFHLRPSPVSVPTATPRVFLENALIAEVVLSNCSWRCFVSLGGLGNSGGNVGMTSSSRGSVCDWGGFAMICSCFRAQLGAGLCDH